jgi:perosamine synthetase
MAVTDEQRLADRMRMMSLHGLSHDAWGRYSGAGSWDYQIVEAGYKYNMTDVAAAIGVHQLARAEAMRVAREQIAHAYLEEFAEVDEVELPVVPANRLLAWHLFPIRLRLEKLTIDRNTFFSELRAAGVGCSVHWRPLHLHPYYRDGMGWPADLLPTATRVWERLVSLPLFPDMTPEERARVVEVVRALCTRHRVR